MRWRTGQSVPRADILRGCKTQAPWKGVERKLQYESSTRCLVFLAKQDGMGGVLRWVWWPFILPHHNLCKLSPHIGHTDLRYLRYVRYARSHWRRRHRTEGPSRLYPFFTCDLPANCTMCELLCDSTWDLFACALLDICLVQAAHIGSGIGSSGSASSASSPTW